VRDSKPGLQGAVDVQRFDEHPLGTGNRSLGCPASELRRGLELRRGELGFDPDRSGQCHHSDNQESVDGVIG
jgi:hypothetical protein